MNDLQNHDKPRPKRPYRKPELVLVPLRPEEAVLGACKTGVSGGPGVRPRCSSGCLANGS